MTKLPVPRRAHAFRDDDGVSLAELLVTILLFGIVGTVVMNTIVITLKTQTRQVERTDALNAAKRALERVAIDMRDANPILDASSRSVKALNTVGGVQTTATYAVTDTKIVATRERKTLSTGAVTTSTEVVLANIALGSAEALFHYYDSDSVELTPVTGTTYDASLVRLITFSPPLRLAHAAQPIRIDERVSLRNAEE
jgi:type II secretory pathway pseudopilin PulG